MTLRFCALGSGSRGNALLVESADTLLMIDCGLARSAIEQRMAAVDRSPADITAILITHEHADHWRGVGSLVNKYDLPVWMTPGTAGATEPPASAELFNCHKPLEIGSIDIVPFPVPHDAREPCQFVFESGNRRLGLLTDTGHVTPHVCRALARCDALALEFNHDADRLWSGSYPESVKSRVASNYGHLNNQQSAELLARVGHPDLRQVVAMHVSAENNSADLVRRSVESLLDDCSFALDIALQDTPTNWYEID